MAENVPATTDDVLPEPTGNPLLAGVRIGALGYEAYLAARLEIEHHLHLREALESGEYKELVAHARETLSELKGFEPREAFFKMFRTSSAAYSKREKELRELGVETVATLKGIGLKQKDIRMLADAPAELRADIRKKVEAGEINRDLVDAITSKVVELAEAKQAERQKAAEEKRRREAAEQKEKDTRAKLATALEEGKALTAELADARKGIKDIPEQHADVILKQFTERIETAFAALNGIDWHSNPVLAARTFKAIEALRPMIRAFQAETLWALEGTDEKL